MFNPIEAEDFKRAWRVWLASRPAIVQEIARLFPYGTLLCYIDEKKMYVIGYTDAGDIRVSPIVPWEVPHQVKREALDRSVVLSGEAARMGALKIVHRKAA